MRKIPNLLEWGVRLEGDGEVGNESAVTVLGAAIREECRWVLDPDNFVQVAEKWDGVPVLSLGGVLYRAWKTKLTDPRPRGWIHWLAAEQRLGNDTGGVKPPSHGRGWVPIDKKAQADVCHFAALTTWARMSRKHPKGVFDWHTQPFPPQGTYELVGPTVAGNHHNIEFEHFLVPHHHNLFHLWDLELPGHRDGTGAPLNESEPEKAEKKLIDGLRGWLDDETAPNIEGLVFTHPDGRMCKVKKKEFGYDWPPKREKS